MKKLGLVAALLLLAPRVAAAWTYIELTHPRWGTPFEIELGAPSADLEGIAAGTTEAELQKAIDDWRFVPCAEVPIDLVGQSGAAAILGDGKNVVTFYESDWPHDFSFVGMTSYETDSCSAGWCMVEADVELNGVNYVWTEVRGSLPYVNARSILMHELGHALGLGHSSVSGAAMNPRYTRGYLFIADDDVDGICTLYPREEPRICEGDDCPFGLSCVDGECRPATRVPCTTHNDCAYDERCNEESGRCVQEAPGGDAIGHPCSTEADCDEGILCEPVLGRSICTVPCDGLTPRSCPTGFYCERKATAECGTGYCAPVREAGGGALGTPCETSSDCGSLHCADGICTTPCDLDAPICPPGLVCHADMDEGCGACAKPRPLGAPCVDNGQCDGELCLDYRRGGICTAVCESHDDCPAALRCLAEGGARFCLPPPKDDGCGCQSTSPGGAAPVVLSALLLWISRRRRR